MFGVIKYIVALQRGLTLACGTRHSRKSQWPPLLFSHGIYVWVSLLMHIHTYICNGCLHKVQMYNVMLLLTVYCIFIYNMKERRLWFYWDVHNSHVTLDALSFYLTALLWKLTVQLGYPLTMPIYFFFQVPIVLLRKIYMFLSSM